MTWEEIAQIAISIFIILSALAVAETKKVVRMALAFCVMSVLIAAMFLILSAPYAAVFQLAIYAGFIPIIILVAIALMRGGEGVED